MNKKSIIFFLLFVFLFCKNRETWKEKAVTFCSVLGGKAYQFNKKNYGSGEMLECELYYRDYAVLIFDSEKLAREFYNKPENVVFQEHLFLYKSVIASPSIYDKKDIVDEKIKQMILSNYYLLK